MVKIMKTPIHEKKLSITNRNLVLYLEDLTMTPHKTSTSGNTLLLRCINIVEVLCVSQVNFFI